MIITTPIAHLPEAQVRASAASGLPELPKLPAGTSYEAVLSVGLAAEGGFAIQGLDARPVLETAAGVFDDDGNYHVQGVSSWTGLIGLGGSVATGLAGSFAWVVAARPLVVLHPTLALEGRLRRQRRITRSITGKAYVTSVSPEQVFECSLRLAGYPHWGVAEQLEALDGNDVFCVLPAGVEPQFHLTGAQCPAWRKPVFARNCQLAQFSGWRGNDGLDIGGVDGTMRFVETSLPVAAAAFTPIEPPIEPPIINENNLLDHLGNSILTEAGENLIIDIPI